MKERNYLKRTKYWTKTVTCGIGNAGLPIHYVLTVHLIPRSARPRGLPDSAGGGAGPGPVQRDQRSGGGQPLPGGGPVGQRVQLGQRRERPGKVFSLTVCGSLGPENWPVECGWSQGNKDFNGLFLLFSSATIRAATCSGCRDWSRASPR